MSPFVLVCFAVSLSNPSTYSGRSSLFPVRVEPVEPFDVLREVESFFPFALSLSKRSLVLGWRSSRSLRQAQGERMSPFVLASFALSLSKRSTHSLLPSSSKSTAGRAGGWPPACRAVRSWNT